MSRRTVQNLAWIGGLALLALHLDFWRPRRAVLHLGWIPEELLWRLAWMALAFGYLLWFCAFVWNDDRGPDEERGSEEEPGGDGKGGA